MRKKLPGNVFLLICCASFFLPHLLNEAAGQSCLPEGITFSSQEQIDNFQTNYPDCIEIEGGVLIEGNDITNLEGLSLLEAVDSFF
jgi:hypothetical protein